MNGFENHAGFNISSSKLQVVEVNYKDKQFYLRNVDEVYFDDYINFLDDKETKITSLLQSAFNEVIIKNQLSSSFVSFTLPLELFHIMQIPYDSSLLNNDLIEEFRWEFSVLYPYISPNDLVIHYIEVENNRIIPYNTAIVTAIRRKYLKLIKDFCSQNKLELRFIDNSHFASERVLALNSLSSKGLVLSVYINKNYLSIIFSLEGKPVKYKLFRLTNAGEITGYLLNEIKNEGGNPLSPESFNASFISGEDLSPSLVRTLKNTIGIEFIQFNPFEKIKPDPKLIENKFYSERYNSFSPAAGIAFRLA
jgi:hypothetical protein